MFKDHEQIVLTADVLGDEREELKSGDVGTIIHIHPDKEALWWSSCLWMVARWLSRLCCPHRCVP